MKRNILILAAFLLFIAGTFSACEKSALVEEDDLYIYAQVENASEFSNVVEVKLMIGEIELARGDWKGDGFVIVLPETLDTNILWALIDNRGLPTTQIINSSTATISNTNAKIADAHFVGVDKDGIVVSNFNLFEIDKDGNPIITQNRDNICLRYVDSYVTVSGYTEHTYGSFNVTHFFSIEWKKGWNVVWISESVSEGKLIHKWSTIPISRLIWNGIHVTPPIVIY